ncbi:MAG: UDP-N-acetylglucosamine 4,6-dehydratase (inverting) [Alphaproteobacteria bacterium]|nr:UDP-N-acetylglucosamine 4,6-dehydratase (inverting) [Alphaproteobacteria bacterium]
MFEGASVLVTGATGSFGRAFIARLLQDYKPARLVVFSRDELKQHEMQVSRVFLNRPEIRYFIGDVRDVGRLRMAMRGVDYVVHAAALKQITTAEYNPLECVHTNIMGAENVVTAAIDCGIKRVIALSTDKAVNPVSLYGATKLASDKIFIAANNIAGPTRTRFSVVRYGNVAGSRGSVVPLFRRMIAEGASELPITDERMTRFWITLDEGVDFVLSCFHLMHGGEIFVPKIPSLSVVDLAKIMAPELPHRIVGIRPGEKLHEVMITEEDSPVTFDLGDRYVIEPTINFWNRPSFAESNYPLVSPDFRYASNMNTQWLDEKATRDIISACAD